MSRGASVYGQVCELRQVTVAHGRVRTVPGDILRLSGLLVTFGHFRTVLDGSGRFRTVWGEPADVTEEFEAIGGFPQVLVVGVTAWAAVAWRLDVAGDVVVCRAGHVCSHSTSQAQRAQPSWSRQSPHAALCSVASWPQSQPGKYWTES